MPQKTFEFWSLSSAKTNAALTKAFRVFKLGSYFFRMELEGFTKILTVSLKQAANFKEL